MPKRCAILLLLSFVANAQELDNLDGWRRTDVITLDSDLKHVQGIDIEENRLWVSSVDMKSGKGYLSLFELPSGKKLSQVEVQEGKRIHPGGIAIDGESIWLPVAEYHRGGPTTIQRRNKLTLALESNFTVNDHIGCVAADHSILYGGNWDSRTIYSWSKSGQEVSRKPNPQQTSYQDLKFVDGVLLGSGNVSKEQGAVEWLHPTDLRVIKRLLVGKTDRGQPYTHEGMAFRNGKIFFLPEDYPSRLFIFGQPHN